MKLLKAFAFFLAVCLPAFSQVGAPATLSHVQFSDVNGVPLAGGFVYTCVAGSSCPGTPQVSYSTQAGAQNQNPIVLDAGGFADLWFGALPYKIVVQDLNGVQQYSTDNIPSLLALSNALGTSLSGGTGATLVGYTGAGGTITTVAAALQARAKNAKTDFGAVGDGSTDDTVKLQACLTWASSNRGSCYLPSAQYAIEKTIPATGLTMASASVLWGDAPYGEGQPQIVSYGSATPLTIGTDVSSLVYGVQLQNVAIVPAASSTAAIGLNVLGLSEAKWSGVNISGVSTGGKFTSEALRFVDSGIISIDGLVISNLAGAGGLGTTAVLFDEPGTLAFGNNNIDLKHADIYFESKVFDVKNCDSCRVTDAVNLEAFDYLLNIDNTSTPNANFDAISFWITNSSITADQSTYFTNRKFLNLNAVTGKAFYGYMVDIEGNRIVNAGGITYPAVVTAASGITAGLLNIRMAGNSIIGANTAVVNVLSPTSFPHFTFGMNHVANGAATVRTPDVVPFLAGTNTYLIDEATPIGSTFLPLAYKDTNGTDYRAGSSGSTMTRPAVGAAVPGAIYGVDQGYNGNSNGFIRVGASGGGSVANYSSYCDFSGTSSVTDMDRNIVCFAQGAELLRMDGNGIRLGGSIYSYLSGLFKATGSLSFGVPTVPGCASTTLAVTGAAVGDRVSVAPPSLPSTMSLTGAITSAGVATIQWCQMSGAAAAGPSGSYSVTAIR